MKPMLSIYHPFPGVAMIKIYAPVMPDDHTISFLVIIDKRYVSFELNEDGEWNDLSKYAIEGTIVDFVRKRIELFYLPLEKKK